MEHLVSWVHEACKVSRETWVRQGRWVSRVFLAFLARSDPWASKGLSVQRDNLVQSAFAVSKANLVQQVCVAHLVRLVLLVQLVFVARLALLVSRGRWVQLDRRETQAHRVSRVILVPSDLRGLLVLPVLPERTARMVSLDQWVLVAIAVHKVCVVSLAPLALKASRVRKARKVALGLADSKASKAPRVTLATVDLSVLVVVVLPVLRVLKESKVPRVSAESLALVLVGQLVLWDPRESVARWASRVLREILVHLVLRVSEVVMA